MAFPNLVGNRTLLLVARPIKVMLANGSCVLVTLDLFVELFGLMTQMCCEEVFFYKANVV